MEKKHEILNMTKWLKYGRSKCLEPEKNCESQSRPLKRVKRIKFIASTGPVLFDNQFRWLI